MKKKVISLLLASAMVLGITACGGEDSSQSSGGGEFPVFQFQPGFRRQPVYRFVR